LGRKIKREPPEGSERKKFRPHERAVKIDHLWSVFTDPPDCTSLSPLYSKKACPWKLGVGMGNDLI
jgi:hypothetical protein